MTNTQIGRVAKNFIKHGTKKGYTHCTHCIFLNHVGKQMAKKVVLQLGINNVMKAALELEAQHDGNMYYLFSMLNWKASEE